MLRGRVPKSELEAAEKGQTRPFLRPGVPALAWPGAGGGLRATVGATVRGAAGRGQGSRQTVTFSCGLSGNSFSGRCKEVEAFVLKRFLPPDKTEEGLAGRCGPAPGAAGPADSSRGAEAAVVFVRLAAHAACGLCVRVKPRAHGRAPWASAGGRNEPSSPQLANSKQIKVSLVPAPLFRGALWGDWGCRGEQAGTWAGLSEEGPEPTSAGPWRCDQERGGAAASIFLTCTAPGGKLGWPSCPLWPLDRDPLPRFPRGRRGLQPQ